MNNTAEQDLALQKECLALLIHHFDWKDQFTFVRSLASQHTYFGAVLHGKTLSLPFCHYGGTENYSLICG